MNRSKCSQLLLAGLMIVLLGVIIKLYGVGIRMRQRRLSMTPQQAERAQLELIAITANIAQTNWTLIVVPRTNPPSTN